MAQLVAMVASLTKQPVQDNLAPGLKTLPGTSGRKQRTSPGCRLGSSTPDAGCL